MSEITINLPAEQIAPAPKQETATLLSYTLPWTDVSLLDFLRQAGQAPRVYWENDRLATSFAGFGVAARLTAHDQNRFETIRCQASRLFDKAIQLRHQAPPCVGPRLFGGFSFRAQVVAQGVWSAFPAACFVLPRFQLTRLNGHAWLTVNYLLQPQELVPCVLERLRAEVRALRQRPALVEEMVELRLQTDDLTAQAVWCNAVAETTHRIRGGNLDKVVLARARRIHTDRAIAPLVVLARLRQKYPNCYRFLFEPAPGHAFYGATPELLADVTGSNLRTIALAGSIRRGQTPSEDELLGQELLAHPKERHEHALVIEAVQENLQPIICDLTVAAQPNLLKLSNIQHLQTEISGKLTHVQGILPVVAALHPTPALGGRPRLPALDLIERTEPISRGWYGSPIGWLDSDHNGIIAVAIRAAVSVGREALLYAGAGIVADSVPQKEWRETQLKFRPLMEALVGDVCE